MTPEQRARIESLFHAAAEQPPAQRSAFLERHEPDASLRAAVQRLLDCDDAAALDPISRRLARLLDERPPPRTVGGYRSCWI